jgi:caa(3)-type oxidase subunit IV
MSNQPDSHDIEQQKRKYLMVFAALIVFTLITVGASYLHIQSTAISVAVAMAVSCIEALLVGGIMMHLFSERKIIYFVLVLTFVFFTALMFLILWANQPGTRLHIH